MGIVIWVTKQKSRWYGKLNVIVVNFWWGRWKYNKILAICFVFKKLSQLSPRNSRFKQVIRHLTIEDLYKRFAENLEPNGMIQWKNNLKPEPSHVWNAVLEAKKCTKTILLLYNTHTIQIPRDKPKYCLGFHPIYSNWYLLTHLLVRKVDKKSFLSIYLSGRLWFQSFVFFCDAISEWIEKNSINWTCEALWSTNHG